MGAARWLQASGVRTCCALGVLLCGIGAAPAFADSLSLTSVTLPSGLQATVPTAFSETGAADPGATISTFVQGATNACASTAAGEASLPGVILVATATVSGSFSISQPWTPPQQGNFSACVYLTVSTGSSQQGFDFTVGPAPPPSSTGAPGGTTMPGGTTPPSTTSPGTTMATSVACKVPSLVGHSLPFVRRLLARVHCALGKVSQPSRKRLRQLRARGPVRLRVAAQRPKTGTVLASTGNRVSVTLGARRAP
jgi:hypothetical protein